jgi:hypothetical protein
MREGEGMHPAIREKILALFQSKLGKEKFHTKAMGGWVIGWERHGIEWWFFPNRATLGICIRRKKKEAETVIDTLYTPLLRLLEEEGFKGFLALSEVDHSSTVKEYKRGVGEGVENATELTRYINERFNLKKAESTVKDGRFCTVVSQSRQKLYFYSREEADTWIGEWERRMDDCRMTEEEIARWFTREIPEAVHKKGKHFLVGNRKISFWVKAAGEESRIRFLKKTHKGNNLERLAEDVKEEMNAYIQKEKIRLLL